MIQQRRTSRKIALVLSLIFLFCPPTHGQAKPCDLALAALALHLEHGPHQIPSGALASLLWHLETIPTPNGIEPAVLKYVEKQLGLRGKIEAGPPPTIPTSPSRVYMVRENGREIAVFKIFFNDPQALTRELAAIRILQEAKLPHVAPVEVLDVGKIQVEGRDQPFLLMSVAKKVDLEQMIRETAHRTDVNRLDGMRRAVTSAGQGLSELHQKFLSPTPDREALASIAKYEVKRLSTLTRPDGVLDRLAQLGWLTPEEVKEARKRIEAMSSDYERQTPAIVSVLHGDAHQGNFFFDPETGKVQLIDVQTLMWSLNPKVKTEPKGIVDANADAGRFLGALEVNGIASGLTEGEITTLQRDFLSSYAKGLGKTPEELAQSLHFFRLRFINNVLEDFEGKKINEPTRRALLDHLLKELGVRGTEPATGNYGRQDRGDEAAYARYFAGMDNTMRQKIALTTALFPTEGTIADMGSGSGKGSADLGALYPGMNVTGVDINPKAVSYSLANHRARNVTFKVGDIADKVFPDNSLDGILDSSVLHHVTTFNDFSLAKALHGLDNQVAQLKDNGILVVRDFVVPDGPQRVYLDLPTSDGKTTGEIPELSSSALFEVFARDFKSSVHRSGNIPFRKLPSPNPSFVRFEVDYRTANEFILRKDYRKTPENWKTELQEEYSYLTQTQFEQEFSKRGLRVLVSKPIHNPWITENRFKEKFILYDLEGKPLPYPPTNYLIVGQKISATRPVSVQEESHSTTTAPNWLRLEHYKNTKTGMVYDVVSRPDDSFDVIPWYELDGSIYVLNRQMYPRPIVNAKGMNPSLNRGTTSGYLVEPITALVNTKLSRVENIRQVLAEQGQIPKDAIVAVDEETKYFPSPGGINELVHGQVVQIKPQTHRGEIPKGRSGLSESGFVQPMNAQQALRSYQVGGMFDSRLEINIYNLLLKRNKSVGPWIGAEVKLQEQPMPSSKVLSALRALDGEKQSVFEKVSRGAGYLEVRKGVFYEQKADGGKLKTTELEYVVPKGWSRNSISAIPVVKSGGHVYVGLETRELPAPQLHEGTSTMMTNPAWRPPDSVNDLDSAQRFLTDKLKETFQVKAKHIIPLGGEYYVSPGVTPEVVFPMAVEVEASTVEKSDLKWVRLDDLLEHRDKIRDGHLLTAMYRLAHAVGTLK